MLISIRNTGHPKPEGPTILPINTLFFVSCQEVGVMTLPCFICDRMRSGNPKKHRSLQTTGSTQACLLCNRDFCDVHKGSLDGVCEINHETYHANHPNLPNIYPTLDARPEN
jgi:hypothetical protein